MKKTLHLLASSLAVFAILVVAGSHAVLSFERTAPNANIRTPGDAMWWTINICSVGDAHFYPVTTGGRIAGAILIVAGYSCFALNVGIVSAFISHAIQRKR